MKNMLLYCVWSVMMLLLHLFCNMKNMLQDCGVPWCCCYICYRDVEHEKHVAVLYSTMMLLFHLLQSCWTWKTCCITVVYLDATVTFVTELLNMKNMLCYSPVVYHDAAVTFVTELLNIKTCCVTVLWSTMMLLLHLLQSYSTWKTCYITVVYLDATVTFVAELFNMKNTLQYCGLPWCCCYICYRAMEHKKSYCTMMNQGSGRVCTSLLRSVCCLYVASHPRPVYYHSLRPGVAFQEDHLFFKSFF